MLAGVHERVLDAPGDRDVLVLAAREPPHRPHRRGVDPRQRRDRRRVSTWQRSTRATSAAASARAWNSASRSRSIVSTSARASQPSIEPQVWVTIAAIEFVSAAAGVQFRHSTESGRSSAAIASNCSSNAARLASRWARHRPDRSFGSTSRANSSSISSDQSVNGCAPMRRSGG